MEINDIKQFIINRIGMCNDSIKEHEIQLGNTGYFDTELRDWVYEMIRQDKAIIAELQGLLDFIEE